MPATLKGLLQITTFNHCHFRNKETNTKKSIKSITSNYAHPLVFTGYAIWVNHKRLELVSYRNHKGLRNNFNYFLIAHF